MLFSDLSASYLEYVRAYDKARTYSCFCSSVRILTPYFPGEVDLAAVSRFVEHRRALVSDATVNRDLRVLKAILRFHGIAKPKIRFLRVARKRIVPVLTSEQISTVLNNAEGWLYGVLLVALNTGFRTDEILHLQWADILWSEHKIKVSSKEDWSSKSHQERSVYVSEALLSYLGGLEHSCEWVFPNRWGRPLQVTTVCHKARRAFMAAGCYFPGCATIHLIRKTVATTLLSNGIDIETVREILGHASITTTQLYVSSLDASKHNASSVLSSTLLKLPVSHRRLSDRH